MTRRALTALILACVLALLVACAASAGGTKRTDAMTEYAAAVRWNDFDKAWDFIDPAVRAEKPLSDLERERFRQIQVTAYDVRNRTITPDGLVLEQTVEIRLVNRNTQVERSLTDHQRWAYDPIAKIWWLTSGLPDFGTR
ncbi:MAG: hypothetical protein ACREO3_09895 [Arenimonas sp.]